MGVWSYYFFVKLFLFFIGYMGFSPWLNLGFAIFTVLPAHSRRSRFFKQVIALPAGIALLYHDSWFPPFRRVLAQTGELAQFSTAYLADLVSRLVNVWIVLAVLTLGLAHLLLSRRLRMSTFVFLGLGVAALMPVMRQLNPHAGSALAGGAKAKSAALTAPELNARLSAFFETEGARRVAFPASAAGQKPFDLIYLHICSVAHDDLNYVNLGDHPLLQSLELRLNNFSAAASYSGPAAIRLLRSGCGQVPHQALYLPADAECYLFNQLRHAGYTPQLLLNHDGRFGDFIGTLRAQQGMDNIPLIPASGRVAMRNFDGSPIYDDYDALAGWWEQRQHVAGPVALYYNSVSLHDGNPVDGGPRSARESYAIRAKKFLDDLERFFARIESSGARAVVVFVPEHGANVRGDRKQISGLREVPSPAIGLVPAGIKLIGLPRPSATRLDLAAPGSHIALSQLVAGFLYNSPFDRAQPDLAGYARDLAQTNFVAENEGMIVMHEGGRYYLRNPDQSWESYQ